MPEYAYAYGAGFDAVTLTNVEAVIHPPPKGKIVPLGGVKRRTLNQHAQWNGTREIKWYFSAMSWDDFEALIEDMFGDWDTESVEQTIDSRARDETFHRYNVETDTPVEGEDYTRREFGNIEDLTITHRVIAEIAIP